MKSEAGDGMPTVVSVDEAGLTSLAGRRATVCGMRHMLPLLLFVALTGCGTGVYNHKIDVTINDPAKRLGPAPIEMSVFDKNGYSEDWARRTIGTTEPGKPYNGKAWGTDTKMFYDRTPSATVDAGVFVPSLESNGYFVLQIRPVSGTEQTTLLNYASFGVMTAEEDTIAPLPARFSSEAASKGWTIHLIVDVPASSAKKP